jgi:hypothetical protein
MATHIVQGDEEGEDRHWDVVGEVGDVAVGEGLDLLGELRPRGLEGGGHCCGERDEHGAASLGCV